MGIQCDKGDVMDEQLRLDLEAMYTHPETADMMQAMDDDEVQYAHYFD
jgi:hypothetical protein